MHYTDFLNVGDTFHSISRNNATIVDYMSSMEWGILEKQSFLALVRYIEKSLLGVQEYGANVPFSEMLYGVLGVLVLIILFRLVSFILGSFFTFLSHVITYALYLLLIFAILNTVYHFINGMEQQDLDLVAGVAKKYWRDPK